MASNNIQGPAQYEIEIIGKRPLAVSSPGELEKALQEAYNQLYALTHGTPADVNQPINMVSVLARLRAPREHVNHFRFRKSNLDINRLEMELKIAWYQDEEPDWLTQNDHFRTWFPFLFQGQLCGYGNMRDWGHETVNQFVLKLSVFPALLERVREYHELVQRRDVSAAERRQRFPDFAYFCAA